MKVFRKNLKEQEGVEKNKEKTEDGKGKLKLKKVKQKRLKGVSWVRSRLKEYQRKQKELMPQSFGSEDKSIENKHGADQVECLPKPLHVEGTILLSRSLITRTVSISIQSFLLCV